MTPMTENGLERRVLQFCTICAKDQPLNQKNEEAVTSFSPNILGCLLSREIGLCGKVSMGLYGANGQYQL